MNKADERWAALTVFADPATGETRLASVARQDFTGLGREQGWCGIAGGTFDEEVTGLTVGRDPSGFPLWLRGSGGGVAH